MITSLQPLLCNQLFVCCLFVKIKDLQNQIQRFRVVNIVLISVVPSLQKKLRVSQRESA